jgi:NAD(P)-dependent dehydrogenase (short-subunit alcohol dehydrogenase family)
MLDVVDKLTAEGSGKFVTYDGGAELDPPVDTPFDNAVPDPLPEVEAGEGRYALVTGASSGIGLGIVEALAGANWNVLATVRKNSEELAAVAAAKSNVTVIEGVDVAKEEGVDAMFAGASAALGDNKLDLLFNNAGLMTPQDMAAMGTKEGVEAADYQFNVNTVGALAGTVKLMPLIKESTGRIAFTTSGLGSLPFLQMGAFPSLFGYSMSKNALNMVAATLARDLKSKGIFVAALHPGVVTSKLSTGFEMDKLTPEQSAKAMLKVVADLTEETTGGFFHYKGTPYEVPKE